MTIPRSVRKLATFAGAPARAYSATARMFAPVESHRACLAEKGAKVGEGGKVLWATPWL